MKRLTGPLFKWFGSKWNASLRYPAPLHEHIFDFYAGGAGYPCRHSDREVTLYDRNPNLELLWRWLIGPAEPSDVLGIPTDLPAGTDIRTLDLSLGQQMLLKHWQRTNNVGPSWTTSPWGTLPGQWTANTRARVAREIEFVKHWKFESPSYHKVGTYFIDPPYQYNYSYGFPIADYAPLGRTVRSLPRGSQVICCEAVCQKTGRVPDYLPFREFGLQVTSRRKANENHHSHELIYYLEQAP
jgi:hypothetical protein